MSDRPEPELNTQLHANLFVDQARSKLDVCLTNQGLSLCQGQVDAVPSLTD